MDALGDERWEVRSQAAEALAELGDHRALAELLTALEDDHWSVRNAAARAIIFIIDRISSNG
jgi:HEAT repeat protein